MFKFNKQEDDIRSLNEEIDKAVGNNFRLTNEEYSALLEHTPPVIGKSLVSKKDTLAFAQQQLYDAVEFRNDMVNQLTSHGIEFYGDNMERLGYEDNDIAFKNIDNNAPGYIWKQRERIPQIGKNLLSKIYTNLLNDIKELDIQFRILEKGESGENAANKFFSLFSGKYPVRNNIILPVQDAFAQSSEIDTYIITPKGLVVCEIKNWGNENDSITIERDGQWFRGRTPISSPVEQNTRHCIATEKYLGQYGIQCRIIPIIIIANTKTAVYNNSSNVVLRVSDVYNFIESLNYPETLTAQEQNKILKILDSCGTPEKKFQCYDFQPQKDYYNAYLKKALEVFEQEMATKRVCADIIQNHLKMLEKRNFRRKVVVFSAVAVLALVFIIRNFEFIKFMLGLAALGLIAGGASRRS